MMSGESEEKRKNTLTSKKKKMLYTLISTGVVLILLAGLIYAWFVNQSDMETLLAIKPPSDISILGPNGEEMSFIDLNYTDNDRTGNTVTVRRVFCVQTAADEHRLEIAHTTNLKGLQFKIYKVSENGTESVTDGGYTYQYNQTPVDGSYINVANSGNDTVNYKYADNTYHKNNYNTYDWVQIHAEPVYWLATGNLPTDKTNSFTDGNMQYYRTYYVCEVSWTETTKETDVFYILAE